MPLYHMSDISLIVSGLLNGSKAILQSHAVKSLDFVDKFRATTAFVVPAEINSYAKNQPNYTLESLTDLLVAGSRLSNEIGERFLELYKVPVMRNGYGSTEMGWTAIPPVGCKVDFACSGVVLPGVQLKFVDKDTGKLCGPNEIGEICMKSPQLFTEYLDNEKANLESFDADGFFRTGDGGYFDEHGLIYVTDRYKEVIKCNGIQVSPTELEILLT